MEKGLKGIAIAIGAGTAALSLPASLLMLLMAVIKPGNASLTPVTTVAFSILAAGAGLGLGLVWAGWRSLRGKASHPLTMGAPWLLTLFFLVLLALGEGVRRSVVGPLLLPPIHVAASLLPPLILITAVTVPLQRAGVQISQRDLAWQLGYGGLAAVILAGLAETVVLIASGLLGGVLLMLTPGGQAALEQLGQLMNTPDVLENPQLLLGYVNSPALILAGGLILALLAPAIEEVAKSLGVWCSGAARRRLSQGQAFAFGLMAGAGFSLIEALFNGAVLLPDAWVGVVVTRAGTTLIHGLASGLMGLAWQAMLTRQGWQRTTGWIAAAVGLHGVWNVAGGLLALSSAGAAWNANGSSYLAGGVLALLLAFSLAGLIWLTRRLADASRLAILTPGDDAVRQFLKQWRQ